MQLSVAKLLLVSVLYVVSHVKAENKVTLIDFNVDVPSNDIIDSWNYEQNDNLFNSNVNVKKNCPGVVEADISIYQDGNKINQINKKFNHPIKDLEDYKICSSLESPDLEDDSCSIAEGEQIAKDCDISGWFSDMSPGDYKIECYFKQSENELAHITMNVKIESG